MEQEELSDYAIDFYEVTVGQYAECVEAQECAEPNYGIGCNWMAVDKDYHPINCISQEDAMNFCQFDGKYLCDYSAWEHAARGNGQGAYPWGEELPDCERTNFNNCTLGTAEVGSYPEDISPFGLMDMGG